MPDIAPFETTLEQRLRARAAIASRPFDARAIATAAVRESQRRRRARWFPAVRPLVGWVVLLTALALGVAALLGGGRPTPSGSRAVLAIGGSDGLFYAHPDGSAARLVRKEGPYFQPRWSSDGAFLAVTLLHPEDANHLYVLRPDGSIVAEAAGVQDFAWAPAGHDLAVLGVGGRDFKVITPRPGEATSLPKPNGLPMIDSFDWAPDGQRLVVAAHAEGDDGTSSIWVVDRAGAPAVAVTAEHPASLPAWSPDGRWIAAVVRAACPGLACRTDVRVYPAPNGGRRWEIQGVSSPGSPRWSFDSGALLLDSVRDGQRDVFRVAVDAISIQLTSSPANDVLVGWDPGGASIVVMRQVADGTSSRTEFWRVAADGTAEVRIAADAYGAALQPLP